MKKIFYLTMLLIILPILTILTINPRKEEIKEKKFDFKENIQVRVKRVEKNIIEVMPLEQYLIGVLAGEMPVSYDIEALKAQAVAARTYTLKKLETNKENEYDIVDTTNDQVYLDKEYLKKSWGENYNEYVKKIKTAIKETSGQYLTYDNQIIKAFFFSTSSGKTENCKDVFGENLPYLQSVSSTWDVNSPSYLSKQTFTKKEFYDLLGLEYREKININIERNETNSINKIIIDGVEIKGTVFRSKLKLRSTNIDIEETADSIIITAKGFGHGVGLSQYGALELSKQGYKYDEILKYYYQGTEIKKI